MRVLADENRLAEVVIRLRVAGHEVRWVSETVQGQAHTHILN